MLQKNFAPAKALFEDDNVAESARHLSTASTFVGATVQGIGLMKEEDVGSYDGWKYLWSPQAPCGDDNNDDAIFRPRRTRRGSKLKVSLA